MRRIHDRCLSMLALLVVSAAAAAQDLPAGLKGRITDPSDASVPGASVALKAADGKERRVVTDEQGLYEIKGLAPGIYSLRVAKRGFAVYIAAAVELREVRAMDLQLALAQQAQQVTVEDEKHSIGTDPNQNAGALILREEDLKSLSDDPDQLASELQALAGPGAGPNGGQIYIDGFTGGRLPPKSSIREVRINQNPYSAEFDRIGFGRIEILTKPGTDRFRGDAFLGFSDESLNSRNPFSPNRAPYQSRMFGGRISGPVTKKSSFGFDFEGRSVDENAIVNATVLDANLQPLAFQQPVVTPQLRLNLSPRFDYQLNEKNTLVARYHYSPIRNDNRGVGEFSLLSRAYDSRDTEHTFQLTETAILNAKAINETRFQMQRSSMRQYGDNSLAAINVLDAFNGGGAQVGLTNQQQSRLELQNLTTILHGRHSIKFGLRLRSSFLSDESPNNFGGSFTFAGGLAPVLDGLSPTGASAYITSLERYRRTLLFGQLGYTAAQIRALGGGATQFSINGGNPLAEVSQTDIGLFLSEDWRVKPTLTLSAGLRWEDQNNISSHNNFAPRLGLAWAIDGGANRQAKTVLRLGAGMFYDRVSDSLTLQALRFNGLNQVNYIVPNPDFFPSIPALADLAAYQGIGAVRSLDGTLRTPYLLQTSIGVDRQLPRNTTIGFNYVFGRGAHLLRARNINSPLADGTLPYGTVGNLYQYESTGFSRQNQWMTNFSTRFSTKVSLFGFYAYGRSKSDTDGVGSFPASTYDLASEYGPSGFDIRHRLVVGGALNARYGISFNPFLMVSSGAPFNITTGRDNNGDTMFNDRPAFATDLNAAGVVQTQWGAFQLNPGPTGTLIPRNYGRGPGSFTLNMRMGRTWSFGSRGESGPAEMGPPGGREGRGPGGPGGGGPPPMMGGGGRGGPGGGGPGGGPGGFFGANSGKRYNLTLSIQARNLLNNVNLSAPNGNLSSPLFGQSTQLAGGFGPGGGGGAAANRRIELMLRFSF
ncbi:MAG: carboxypeptidase regulatory-like domain-containing protein [Bryobacterales bacterium]|nr:carboxypeptidase regulatory-like domain-containing protein [Bryobacterales bacterium]